MDHRGSNAGKNDNSSDQCFLKNKTVWNATLMEEVKDGKKWVWTKKVVNNNCIWALLDCQSSNVTNILLFCIWKRHLKTECFKLRSWRRKTANREKYELEDRVIVKTWINLLAFSKYKKPDSKNKSLKISIQNSYATEELSIKTFMLEGKNLFCSYKYLYVWILK